MSSIKVHDDDDDNDDESSHQVKDLNVVVSDPEKHAGGYVSYNVNTKVKYSDTIDLFGYVLLCTFPPNSKPLGIQFYVFYHV